MSAPWSARTPWRSRHPLLRPRAPIALIDPRIRTLAPLPPPRLPLWRRFIEPLAVIIGTAVALAALALLFLVAG